jgi:hypothetical protein
MSNITGQNIRNQNSTFGAPVGLTIDTIGNAAPYKAYYGSVSTGTSPVSIDVYTDLGRAFVSGYIRNLTDRQPFTVSFSDDGTTFGDEIYVRSDAVLNLDSWIATKAIRITRSGSAVDYEIVVK